MGLLDVVRAGVKIANTVTETLQGTVTYKRYSSQTADGTKSYASPVSLAAIIELKQTSVQTLSGEIALSNSNVLFLDVAALLAATGSGGMQQEDSITLPDGTTSPILNFGGTVDAGTGKPFATQVFLG